MRKVGFGLLLLAAGTLLSVLPAAAESDHDVTTNGEVRVRWEHQENYFDGQDDPPGADDSQTFFPYRALIGVTGHFSEDVVGHIETQAFGWFGSDQQDDGSQSPPDQAFNVNIDDSEVDLFQGWVELQKMWGSNWGIRAGRQTHVLSNELQLGDADFYAGTKFDGLRGMAEYENWNLDLFYYQTFQNTNFGFPFDEDDDGFLAGATAGFKIGDSGQSVTPYILMTRDGDFSGSGFKLYTVGAQWGKPIPEDMSGSHFDWSLEAAFQSGEFSPNNPVAANQLDFGGSIVEGWFGWNWGSDEHHSRVHLGTLMASGDDDNTDDKIDAYRPLFPDDHAHNRLGDLDLFTTGFGDNAVGDTTGGMTNVIDWNIGYDYMGGAHHFMVALHQLALAEEAQLGLTEDGIGTEFDASYTYGYSDNVDLQVGAAMLQTDDGLDQFVGASTDSIMRAWWQVRLHWN